MNPSLKLARLLSYSVPTWTPHHSPRSMNLLSGAAQYESDCSLIPIDCKQEWYNAVLPANTKQAVEHLKPTYIYMCVCDLFYKKQKTHFKTI